MKKKALLIFTLIFWIVGACTFLSIKVEEQMIPQVTAVEPDGGWDRDSSLPADCLIEDENGLHLYKLYEGTGWEAGTRATEEQGWLLGEDKLILGNSSWGDFVQYSSKPLREGELVEVVRGGSKTEDHWLAVFPEGLELELAWDDADLPGGVTAEEWGQRAVQLYVEDDTVPFMASRAKSRVPYLAGATVYSFNDMNQLLDNFTAFGLLLGIFTAVLVIWAFSCVYSKEARRNRWYLCVNLALGVLLLACVPLVLNTVDLPSSLLPRERITDFGTITRAIDEFFGALKSFAPPAAATGELKPSLPESIAGQEIVAAKNMVIARPILFGFFGAFFAAIFALAERVVMYIRRRPRIK